MKPLVVALVVQATLGSRAAWADPDTIRHAPGFAPEPPSLSWSEPIAPSPRDAGARTRRRWGVFGAGVTLFALGYAADAGATYGLGRDAASTSLIPLVGPLLQIGRPYVVIGQMPSSGSAQVDAQVQATASSVNQAVQTAVTVGLVVDFALQLTGAIMTVAGPLTRRRGEQPRFAVGEHGALAVRF